MSANDLEQWQLEKIWDKFKQVGQSTGDGDEGVILIDQAVLPLTWTELNPPQQSWVKHAIDSVELVIHGVQKG